MLKLILYVFYIKSHSICKNIFSYNIFNGSEISLSGSGFRSLIISDNNFNSVIKKKEKIGIISSIYNIQLLGGKNKNKKKAFTSTSQTT